MEDQQPGLFSFGIDGNTQDSLTSIAKWNRFMAWVGIIGSGILILVIIFGGNLLFSNLLRRSGTDTPPIVMEGYSGVLFIYVLFIAVYMVPCFFMLSFANKMLRALAASDQELLNTSFKHLNVYAVYWGILTIIGLFFYLIMIIGVVIAVSSATGIK